jgi:hypothetical protein
MNWIALVFALELGWMSQSLHFEGASYESASFYSELDGAVRIAGVLDVGGRVDTRFVDAAGYEFAPFDARYSVYTEVRWGGLSAGAEHTCIHPVMSGQRPDVGELYGGSDKIYVRFEHGR